MNLSKGEALSIFKNSKRNELVQKFSAYTDGEINGTYLELRLLTLKSKASKRKGKYLDEMLSKPFIVPLKSRASIKVRNKSLSIYISSVFVLLFQEHQV